PGLRPGTRPRIQDGSGGGQARRTEVGAGPALRLRNRPGVAGRQKQSEVALLLLPRGFDLLAHQVVVDRAPDVPENADRRRAAALARQATQRECLARLCCMCVLYEQLARFLQADD